MRLEKKDIYNRELVRKAVSLEFLAYAGSNGGDGKRHVVHSLNFRSLKVKYLALASSPIQPQNPVTDNKANMKKNLCRVDQMMCSEIEGSSNRTHRSNPFAVGGENSTFRIGPAGSYMNC